MFVRSFTKEIDEATQFVRKELGNLILTRIITALIMGGIIIGTIIAYVLIIGMTIAVMPQLSIAMVILLSFLLIVAIVVGGYIMEGCIIVQSEYYYRGSKIEITKSLGEVMEKLPNLIAYACLQVLASIPIIIIPFIIVMVVPIALFVSGINSWDIETYSTGTVFLLLFSIALGIVLCTFLGIIYETCFLFGVPSIVLDDLGPIKALTRSFSFVHKEFWKTVKKVFLYNLGIYGCSVSLTLLVTLVIGIIVALTMIFDSSDPLILMQQLSVLMDWPTRIVSLAVIGSLSGAITSHLYYTQKCKREGADLRKMLDRLKCSEEQSI